ncbi:MAG: hypothetical protein ACR2MN_15160 [Acidimicrobiales bacterium]
MGTVGGDPQGARCLASSWGNRAAAAGAQGAGVSQASSMLGSDAFSGGAGDQTRSFLSELGAASSAVAPAYARVAAYLPRVAAAIEEAQQAERARQKAQDDVTVAEARHAQAELQVTIASAAVNAASAGSSPLGPSLGSVVGAPAGPSPAQLQALTVAQQELQHAARLLEEAQRAFQAADRHFQEADRRRSSMLRAFAALCREEAAVARRAIPEPPMPTFGLLSTLGFSVFQRAGFLAEANIIAKLPQLVATEAARGQLLQVAAAVEHQDWGRINGLLYPAPKAAHHNGGSNILGSILGGAGDVLNAVGGAAGSLLKGGVEGTVSLGGDLVHIGLHPVKTVEGFVAAVQHPGQLISNLVDIKGLERNPFEWAGQLVPSIAAAYFTDGASASATKASALAGDARLATEGSLAAARRAAPDFSAMAPNLAAANLHSDQALRLDQLAARRQALEGALTKGGTITDRAGLAAAAHPSEPCSSDSGSPALPGLVVGHGAEHAFRSS